MTDKKPVGRPRTIDREGLLEALEKYIDETEVPILSEFAWKNGLHREQMYEIPEFSYAIKRLITKKECALEKGTLTGDLNPAMAIFSLKQIGWGEAKNVSQHEIKITGGLPD